MLVVHVSVRVHPERISEFIAATRRNVEASLQEPGVVRFDFAQAEDAPNEFVLVEVYRDAAAPDAHKQTAHYLAWRDAVADMMATPRSSRRFTALSPDAERWRTPVTP